MNKTVVISGGLGDIGRSLATSFCNAHMNVSLCDVIDDDNVYNNPEEVRSAKANKLHYKRVNVTSLPEIEDWLDEVERKFSTPQVIIANAGIVVRGALLDLALEDAKKQIEVNFWGAYNLVVAAARRLCEKNLRGSIIFVGSWAAERPAKGISAYCISKAAVRMLCKSLALELAEKRILVNEIALGIVDGGLSKQNQQKNPGVLEMQLDATPTNLLVSLDEVSKWALALGDFENINITGSNILVDGGLSLTSKMTP